MSALAVNLAAGWLGAIFITPNFAALSQVSTVLVLFGFLISAIMSLLISVILERSLE